MKGQIQKIRRMRDSYMTIRCDKQRQKCLVSLVMRRTRGRSHHGQTRRMYAAIVRLWLSGILALLSLGFLLLLALALLHFEFGALFAVAGALVVQLIVLGYDFGLAAFAVAATASAGIVCQ
jgi:hypothetical protein